MTTLHDVLRSLIERGDLIPDIELPPLVWYEVRFQVVANEDGSYLIDDASVVPDDS